MPKQSQAWKALERYTAEFFGGQRQHRGANFSQSMPDVIAPSEPVFGVDGCVLAECKYSKNQPWVDFFVKELKAGAKYPLFLVKGELDIYLFWLLQDSSILTTKRIKDACLIARSMPGYLEEYYTQSAGYTKSNNDLHIVVLGKKGCKHRVAYSAISELTRFLGYSWITPKLENL